MLSFLIAALLVNLSTGNSESCSRDGDVSAIRTLLVACIAHAKDNDGSFPVSLKMLYSDYIDVEAAFHEKNSNTPYLYRSGLGLSNSPNEPLIISQPDENGDRLIGYIGGHVAESGTVPPEILAEFE